MSTASDLLAAIISQPEEDTPRLVYADYLDETDRPERAEFIRVQVERARLSVWDVRARELWHRERVLLAHHGQDWYRELGTIEHVVWGRFARGFVSAVRVPTLQVLESAADAIRAVAPIEDVIFTAGELSAPVPESRFSWVRGIAVEGYHKFALEHLDSLLHSGIAANLLRLGLNRQGLENPAAELIARCTHLKQLRALDFTECYVGAAGVAALSRAQHLRGLEYLVFNCSGSGYVEDPFVNDEAIDRLAESDSALQSLRSLELDGSRITDRGVQRLLTAPAFAGLESVLLGSYNGTVQAFAVGNGPARWQSLSLQGFNLRDAAGIRMFELPQLQSLTALKAKWCQMPAANVAALARAPFVPFLQILVLNGNGIGTDGARELAAGDWRSLHTLDIESNGIAADGAVELARSGRFPALRTLRIGDNQELADRGIAAIAGASWSGSLRRLHAKTVGMGPDGAAALSHSPSLRRLTDLDLNANSIGADGVQAIAAAVWPELTDIKLGQSKCGEEALLKLFQSPVLANLLTLDLNDTGLTARALEHLSRLGLAHLRELVLDVNPAIAGKGIAALAAPGTFPALCFLSIAICKLPEADMKAVLDSELFTRLRGFVYYGNTLSRSILDQLRRRQTPDRGDDWLPEDDLDGPGNEWE